MKLYDFGIVAVIAIVATAAIVGYGCSKFLGPNSIPEEAAEEVIFEETGVQVDLSGSGQDKDLPKGSIIQFKK